MAIVNNELHGNNDVFQAEIPRALNGLALVSDASQQDVFVLGMLYDNLRSVTPSLGAARYGRSGTAGQARILVGPADLAIPYQANQTYAPRGGVATSAQGPVLAVATGLSTTLYFYSTRSLAPLTLAGATSNSLDLSTLALASKPTKIVAVAGSGTKIYAADATQPIIVQYDLTSLTAALCRIDSQPTAFGTTATGQLQVYTARGTAQITGDCSAGLTSQAPVATAPSATVLDLPLRSFTITERVLEPTMPLGVVGSKGRRGTFVNLTNPSPVMVSINVGSCKRTTFLVGDVFAVPAAAAAVNLTPAASSLALYAEQTYPGEDCTAILSTGTGEALLRIRGSVENLGASTFLLDRSWSMERAIRGVGTPTGVDDQRVAALRTSLVSLVGSLTLPGSTSATWIGGPWAFMPFTDDAPAAWATPASGFTMAPTLDNPDNPNGLRIKGFSTAASDKFDPGGQSDLTQAVRSAVARLQTADALPPDPTGAARRLWIMTDNIAGPKSYSAFPQVLSLLQKSRASLRLFGVGAPGLDPLLQQLVAQSYGLSGDQEYGPARGQSLEAHTSSALHEAVVAATVRDVLRGRPLATISRGEINSGTAKSLSTKFRLLSEPVTNRTDPWVLLIAAWDNADTTPVFTVVTNGSPAAPRCMRSSTAWICALPGIVGDWVVTLTGSRPSGQSTFGVVRAFIGATGPAGDVNLSSSFARAMYKSGDKVRVQVHLTERGLPLRLAAVTAKVFGPTGGLGTVASGASVTTSAVSSLVTSNGDVSPGQAKLELLDPTLVPGQKQVGNLTLSDDGLTGGDNEPQDGIYQAEFSAFIPGIYSVNISATYTGLFPNNTGVIEDYLTTNVVVGMDQALVGGGVRSVPITGGMRVRFVPQDIGKNLLGPGQAAALLFAQGSKPATATVGDFLDGSYRADVTGIDVTQPFDLLSPGSRIQIFDPANSNPGTPMSKSGCMMSPTPQSPTVGLLVAGLALWLVARRRRRLAA